MENNKKTPIELHDVPVAAGMVPRISFGRGSRDLVILPGVSLTPFDSSANAVAARYESFTEDFRVHLLSRRLNISAGCSIESVAEETAEALRAMGISQACVIGISLGGMIAQMLALRYPGLVSRLALVSTSCFSGEGEKAEFLRWAQLSDQRDIPALAAAFGSRVYSPAFYERIARVLPALLRSATDQDTARFSALLHAIAAFDCRSLTPQLQVPAQVFAGEADQVFPVALIEETAALYGAPMLRYPQGAHAIYDESDQLLLDLKAFLS